MRGSTPLKLTEDDAVAASATRFRLAGISVLSWASPKPPTESSLIKSWLITACLYRAAQGESTPFILKHLEPT